MTTEKKKFGANYPQSMHLFERATKVIPGGIYGHVSPTTVVPGEFPYYAMKSKGAHYWDADGKEYIDYMCGYGPIVLGHQYPEVEEAAAKQRELGDCFNHPAPVMIELAEYLVEKVKFADWTVFGKNGSDMTSWSIQVAREHTKRKKILKVKGAYHGTHAWCTPGHAGIIEEDRSHVHDFLWNNTQSFLDLIKKYENEVAAVILTPFHHPAFADSVLPEPEFLKEIESTCKQKGIILILDDVRAGFRLSLGGSHEYFGFEPDIICFSKALGNGYPISAALGRNSLKISASKVFLTGSFWNGAVAMAASLKCLQIIERDNAIQIMKERGEQLFTGLKKIAQKYNHHLTLSGPPAIPFVSFKEENASYKNQIFCSEVTRLGAYFHPHHNWFICASHSVEDINKTLQYAETALSHIQQEGLFQVD
jgi:glutamate-1-semialdehyde 2,1-aminomutase